ncbi:MAG: hypothetical protein MI923_00295, partial [Phycisphaerales bacterium]|nr:hypothetical protein [Phycisphaerales bacterium]
MLRQKWFMLSIGVWITVLLVASAKTLGESCSCNDGPGSVSGGDPQACYYSVKGACGGCTSVIGNGPCVCGVGGESCEQGPKVCHRLSFTETSDFQIQWPLKTTGCDLGGLETGYSTGGLWTNTPNGPLPTLPVGNVIYGMTDLTWPHHKTHVSVYRTYMGDQYQHTTNGDFGARWFSNLSTSFVEVGQTGPLDECEQLGYGGCVELGGQGLVFSRPHHNSKFNAHIRSDGLAIAYECDSTVSPVLYTYFIYDRSSGYTYTFEGNKVLFPSPKLDMSVTRTRNRYGQGEDYAYDSADLLTKITIAGSSPAKEIYLDRDSVSDVITKIYDNYTGRTVDYSYAVYDGNCWLTKVDGAGCGSCSAVPTVEYEYDSNRLLTAVKDAEGHSRKVLFNTQKHVEGAMDAKGRTHRYNLLGAGSVAHLSVDREGNTVKYHGINLVVDQQTAVTRVEAVMSGGSNITYDYEYDSTVKITKVTAPDGATDQRFYDDDRNLVSRIRTAGGTSLTTSFTYETVPNYRISTYTDEVGKVFTYDYDSDGSLTKRTMPGGGAAEYEYDGQGLITQLISDAGITMSYAYDAMGFLTSERVGTLETTHVVDGLGRRLTTTSPEGRKVIQQYDNGGRLTKRISGEGIEMRYEYDANARQTLRELMDGQTVVQSWTTEYDPNGNVTTRTAPGALISVYDYDCNDRLTKQTNPDGTVRELVMDDGCRLITTKFGGTAGTDVTEDNVYDTRSNLVTAKDADGNMTRYEYDGFRRLTKTIDALNHYTVYEYDKTDRQTAVKGYRSDNAILTHTVTEYDGMGLVTRVRQKAVPNGADGNNDALSETVYDDDGRVLTSRTYVGASATSETIYAYDASGRQTRVTDPDGHATTYAYDNDGLLTKITDAKGHAATFAYDNDGRQTKVTDALGHYSTTTYDVRGLQTDASNYASGGTHLAQTVYEYDTVGRQTLSRRKVNPGGAIDNTADIVLKTFYDGDGRVTRTTGASGHDTTYAY